MNAPKRTNRPISYRKRRRGRSIRLAVLTALLTLLVAALAFLIIGNHLLKKVNEQPTEEPEPPIAEPAPLAPQRPTAIQAQAVSLSSLSASHIAELQRAGTTAVSLALNTPEGDLLYRSPLAVSLGQQTAASSLPTLSSSLAEANTAGLYISGIFYLTAFSEEDDLLRSIALSHSAALIAEAIRDGVREVTVLIPSLTAENSRELLALLQQIRDLESSAVLGVGVNRAVLTAENATQTLKEWSLAVNYFAMDLTEETDLSPAAYVDTCLNDAALRYYLLYYQMRLLLPVGASDADSADIAAIVQSNAFSDWQWIAD